MRIEDVKNERFAEWLASGIEQGAYSATRDDGMVSVVVKVPVNERFAVILGNYAVGSADDIKSTYRAAHQMREYGVLDTEQGIIYNPTYELTKDAGIDYPYGDSFFTMHRLESFREELAERVSHAIVDMVVERTGPLEDKPYTLDDAGFYYSKLIVESLVADRDKDPLEYGLRSSFMTIRDVEVGDVLEYLARGDEAVNDLTHAYIDSRSDDGDFLEEGYVKASVRDYLVAKMARDAIEQDPPLPIKAARSIHQTLREGLSASTIKSIDSIMTLKVSRMGLEGVMKVSLDDLIRRVEQNAFDMHGLVTDIKSGASARSFTHELPYVYLSKEGPRADPCVAMDFNAADVVSVMYGRKTVYERDPELAPKKENVIIDYIERGKQPIRAAIEIDGKGLRDKHDIHAQVVLGLSKLGFEPHSGDEIAMDGKVMELGYSDFVNEYDLPAHDIEQEDMGVVSRRAGELELMAEDVPAHAAEEVR